MLSSNHHQQSMTILLSLFVLVLIILLSSPSITTGISANVCDNYHTDETQCMKHPCKYIYDFPASTCNSFPCSQRNIYNCYDPNFSQLNAGNRPIPSGYDRTCFWVPDPSKSQGGLCQDCSLQETPPCEEGCMSGGGGGFPPGPGGGGPSGSSCVKSCAYTSPTETDCGSKSECQLDKRDSMVDPNSWKCALLDMCSQKVPNEAECDPALCIWGVPPGQVQASCRVDECKSKLNKNVCNAVIRPGGAQKCQWDETLEKNRGRCDEIPDCSKHGTNQTLCDLSPCCGYDPTLSVCKIMCNCIKTQSVCTSPSVADYCTWQTSSSTTSTSTSPPKCVPSGVPSCGRAYSKLLCYRDIETDPSSVCHWFMPSDIFADDLKQQYPHGYCGEPPCSWRTAAQCSAATESNLRCFLYNTTNSGMKCGSCGQDDLKIDSSPGFPCNLDPACELIRPSIHYNFYICRRRCDTFTIEQSSQKCEASGYCTSDSLEFAEERTFTRRAPAGWPQYEPEHTMSACFNKLDDCSTFNSATKQQETNGEANHSLACTSNSDGNCVYQDKIVPFTQSPHCLRKCSIFDENIEAGTPAKMRSCNKSVECRWDEKLNTCENACWRAMFAPAGTSKKQVCDDTGACQWSSSSSIMDLSPTLKDIRVNCFPLPRCNDYGTDDLKCKSASSASEGCEWKNMTENSLTSGMCIVKCSMIRSQSICTEKQGGWCKWTISMTTGSYVCEETLPTTTSTTTTSTSTSTTSTTTSTTTTATSTTSTTTSSTTTSTTTLEPTTTTSTTLSPGQTNAPPTTPSTTVTANLDETKPFNAVSLQNQLATELKIKPENIAITKINSSSVAITFVDVSGGEEEASRLVNEFSSFSRAQLASLNLTSALAAPGEAVTTTTPAPPPEVGAPSNSGLLGAVIGGCIGGFLLFFVLYKVWRKKREGAASRDNDGTMMYSSYGRGDEFDDGGNNGSNEKIPAAMRKAFHIDFDDDAGASQELGVPMAYQPQQQQRQPSTMKNNKNNKRQQKRVDPFAVTMQQSNKDDDDDLNILEQQQRGGRKK